MNEQELLDLIKLWRSRADLFLSYSDSGGNLMAYVVEECIDDLTELLAKSHADDADWRKRVMWGKI